MDKSHGDYQLDKTNDDVKFKPRCQRDYQLDKNEW